MTKWKGKKTTNLLLGCLDSCPGGISKPSVGMPS